MRTAISALLVATIGISSASCASNSPKPVPEPIALPVNVAPAFEEINYSSLSPDVQMVVRATTSDLTGQLKAKFPTLATPRASLMLYGETLVRSLGVPYRQVTFYYGDEATLNMHGTCSQGIHVWINSGGDVIDTYVEELTCPI
ncbi:hypothetical protein GCM10010080_31100 [Thermomonas carbonis]|nr:hypothetical protein GCM10010080_31100 [Thermomonas carbonis]